MTPDDPTLEERRSELSKALRREQRRLERKRQAIARDLARAETAPALRHEGDLLLASLHRVTKSASHVDVEDWADGGAPRRIELDPARPAREQAEERYKRARRYERGVEIARAREKSCDDALATLAETLARVDAADTIETLDAIAEATEAIRDRPAQSKGRRAKEEPREPFRTYVSERGRKILVGRGAADNDRLTLHHARMHDLWLHARETAGAHVVVPLSRGEVCPPELLVDAATLAAHFSGARGDDRVDVAYAPRRYVRKPRKSPPGSVVVEREKVITVRVEEARVKRLLATADRV